MENTMEKELVNGDMLIGEILRRHPDSAYLLMNCGMGCIGCPSSQMESLNEACMVHGLEAEEVVKYLNIELGLASA